MNDKLIFPKFKQQIRKLQSQAYKYTPTTLKNIVLYL